MPMKFTQCEFCGEYKSCYYNEMIPAYYCDDCVRKAEQDLWKMVKDMLMKGTDNNGQKKSDI